jgi:glycosyltransferase involved in cell wall biosynthesis
MAGDGVMLIPMKRLAKLLGIESKITFLGNVAQSDLQSRFFDQVDFIVNTRSSESFGMGNAEALMHKTPVLLMDCQGNRESAGGGGGVLIPYHNALTHSFIEGAKALFDLNYNISNASNIGNSIRDKIRKRRERWDEIGRKGYEYTRVTMSAENFKRSWIEIITQVAANMRREEMSSLDRSSDP